MHDQSGQQAAETTSAPHAMRTRLRPWYVGKTLLIAGMFLVLGLWGLIDALVVYPKRGARAAEFFEFQYLGQLEQAGRLNNDAAGIADPASTLDRLRKTAAQSQGGAALSSEERAQMDWLTQLRLIGRLSPASTTYPRDDFRMEDGKPLRVKSAPEQYIVLTAKWTGGADGKTPRAQPLDWYDIPVQWVFVAVGALAGPWMLLGLLRERGKTYTFDQTLRVLGLPGGHTLSPSDIVEYDKSKWERLYVTLVVRPGHATLGGKSVTLDLDHFVPLEEWVLEMEQASGIGPAGGTGGQSMAEAEAGA